TWDPYLFTICEFNFICCSSERCGLPWSGITCAIPGHRRRIHAGPEETLTGARFFMGGPAIPVAALAAIHPSASATRLQFCPFARGVTHEHAPEKASLDERGH